jgi:hypothetical protein
LKGASDCQKGSFGGPYEALQRPKRSSRRATAKFFGILLKSRNDLIKSRRLGFWVFIIDTAILGTRLHQDLLFLNNMGYFEHVFICGRNILSKFTNKEFKSEIKRLLDNGADVNSMDWNRRTFIFYIAEYRQFHIS